MKANIRIDNLSCSSSLETITAKLERINGLTDINVDKSGTRISFNYETEEAALSVIEKLRLASCTPCASGSEGCNRKSA